MIKLYVYGIFKNLKNFSSFIKFKSEALEDLAKLNRNELYLYFYYYFRYRSSTIVKIHRYYFKQDKRGFGEDAFHSMWEIIFKTFLPTSILEIGVYRGQTLSLFNLLSKKNNIVSEVWGITPLDSSADNVSEYKDIDYLNDIKNHFKFFKLNNPNILNSYSTDKKSLDFISTKQWDLIYIDGNHNYETVLSDVNISIQNLKKGGILAMDDSSLYQDFNLQNLGIKAFKGHPGPSKVFESLLNSTEVNFLLGVGHINLFLKN